MMMGPQREGASEGDEHEEVWKTPFLVKCRRETSQSGGRVWREVFQRRSVVTKSVPPFMRVISVRAAKLACKTVVQGNVDMETRGWPPNDVVQTTERSVVHARGWLKESTWSNRASGVSWWRKV